jgi:ElaB/YqjD/DUF883 family membrane-anchored ribosome-binding protein
MAERRVAEDEDDVRSALRRVGEEVQALSERARKAGQRASEAVGEFAGEASDRGRRYAKIAVREVKEHPVTTLAVGAAVGLIIAAVLMRRRDD